MRWTLNEGKEKKKGSTQSGRKQKTGQDGFFPLQVEEKPPYGAGVLRIHTPEMPSTMLKMRNEVCGYEFKIETKGPTSG